MKCPKCQFKNSEGAKFCSECGHNLIFTSKAISQVLSFDEKLEKIQRYLPEGLTEKILSQKNKIEGERKIVTVMFCDMEKFSTLVERLGPEEAYSLMDQVYEILIHKVHDFEGTVNEMTGDGILALFGAPIALEDAPMRALWSAFSIHSEIEKFNNQRNLAESIKMRIGIHTGPVIVGTLGNDLRVEFKAVGNTVNLASRMEQLAESGTTYLTEETFKLAKDLFRFKSVGKKIVKGKKEPVQVYKAISQKESVYRPRLGSERMIFSKMVGRESQFSQLELQVMKAINGEGSIVSIIGEAGIGKSRLVAELKKREVMKQVTLFEGRAISIGGNLSFFPIIDILRQWARIREDDKEVIALRKLEAAVRRLYPEEISEVFPFVATLMGMKLSGSYKERVKGIEGESLEKLILKNMKELLIRATALTPLVIVIEDLHWADTSSIELLGSFFRLVETQRILFINVFRPGHHNTGDRIVKTIIEKFPKYYVEILVEPLNEQISEELIINMLNIGELHHAVIGQIVRRASGNPFFIEEVVRSLIDEGAVVLTDGKFQVTEKIHTMSIPHTINDVLMARIDRLEEKTRSLVKVAAVIGRNFFYRILSEVSNRREDIDFSLAYLKEIQLVRERRRMGELEYLFKHALAQEVAYDSILPPKRKELHLKIAYSIESIFFERLHEVYGMLAYHYSRAETLEKAEKYLIMAGEEALKASASSEALSFYRQALSIYLKISGNAAEPEKKSMLEKNIALVLFNRGQYVEAAEFFGKVLKYYGVKTSKYRIFAIVKCAIDFILFLKSLYFPILKRKRIPAEKDIEILNLFFKKCNALAVIDPKRLFIEMFNFCKRITNFDLAKVENGVAMLAVASNAFSYSGISLKLSRKVLGAVKNIVNENDIKSVIYYEFSKMMHNWLAGNWKLAKKYDDNLVNLNLKIGEIFFTSNYINQHAFLMIELGDFEGTQKMIKILSDIVHIYDHEYTKALKYCLNTKFLMKFRKLNNALDESNEGIEFISKLGEKLFLFSEYSFKTRLQIMMGNIEEADDSLHYLNKIKSEILFPYYLTDFLLSQFLFDIYQLEETIRDDNKLEFSKYVKKALISGRKAVNISQKSAGDRPEIFKLMGTYYWLVGKQRKALKWWNKSIEESLGLGARIELYRTYMEIGKRLLEPQSKFHELNRIRATGYFKKARVFFKEMSLTWDMEELDKIVAHI